MKIWKKISAKQIFENRKKIKMKIDLSMNYKEYLSRCLSLIITTD